MSGTGTTVANGGIAFAVTGFPTLQGRRVDNNGTATWTGGGGSIIFSGGGTFNNNGTFDVQNSQSMGANSGGSPCSNNAASSASRPAAGSPRSALRSTTRGVWISRRERRPSTASASNPRQRVPGHGRSRRRRRWSSAARHVHSLHGSSLSGAGTMLVVQGTVNLAGTYSLPNTVLQGGNTFSMARRTPRLSRWASGTWPHAGGKRRRDGEWASDLGRRYDERDRDHLRQRRNCPERGVE